MHPMQENADAGGIGASSRSPLFWILPPVALIVVADTVTKAYALSALPNESELVERGIIAFAIHQNVGLAFDIPFRMPLIILASVLIGAALVWVAATNARTRPGISVSSASVVIGAAGNLYDRLAYGFTVDYLILFERSAVNLSDAVIVGGVIALLYASRERTPVDKHAKSR